MRNEGTHNYALNILPIEDSVYYCQVAELHNDTIITKYGIVLLEKDRKLEQFSATCIRCALDISIIDSSKVSITNSQHFNGIEKLDGIFTKMSSPKPNDFSTSILDANHAVWLSKKKYQIEIFSYPYESKNNRQTIIIPPNSIIKTYYNTFSSDNNNEFGLLEITINKKNFLGWTKNQDLGVFSQFSYKIVDGERYKRNKKGEWEIY